METFTVIWNVIAEAAGFWMDHLIFINILLSIVIVFFERRDPPKQSGTWLLVLYFIPILGIFLYFMVGHDFHKQHMFRDQGDRGRHVFRHQRTGGDDYP